MKICRANLHSYSPVKGSNRGCPECEKQRRIQWKLNNIERIREIKRNWARKNPEYSKANGDSWNRRNPERRNASRRKRQATKINASPKWLTKRQYDEIFEFYREAKKQEKETGTKMHVDHVIPLQGKNVCGLHVPWNLQLLSESDNLIKSNKLILL